MITELQILIYSYLELEQILGLTKNNSKLRDTIIKRHYHTLPSLEDCCHLGNFETFLYLYNLGQKYDPNMIITDVLNSGNFQFLKFVLTNIITSKNIISVYIRCKFMNIETIKFAQRYGAQVKLHEIICCMFHNGTISYNKINRTIKAFNIPLEKYIFELSDKISYKYMYNTYIKDKEIMHWCYSTIDLGFMQYL